MNRQQEARLQTINDQWPVEHWEQEGAEVHVVCEDGDEAMIHADGTATWKTGHWEGMRIE